MWGRSRHTRQMRDLFFSGSARADRSRKSFIPTFTKSAHWVWVVCYTRTLGTCGKSCTKPISDLHKHKDHDSYGRNKRRVTIVTPVQELSGTARLDYGSAKERWRRESEGEMALNGVAGEEDGVLAW